MVEEIVEKEKQTRKKKLNGKDEKRVLEALTKTNGFLNKACIIVGVNRATLAKYLEAHPEVKDQYQNTIIEGRNDLLESTLLKMALGEVAHEKTKVDKEGNESIVVYRQPPHFMAMMRLLEMGGRYTPKKILDHTVKPFDLDLAGKKMKGYGEE